MLKSDGQQPLQGLYVRPEWKILEVGAGPNRVFKQSTTLDIEPSSAPDVIHDLELTPYPFGDSSFDLIVALHVLEHLEDLVGTIGELHRILRPGGLLYVEVPYFSSVFYFSDPTHRHSFTTRTFDYFIPGHDVYNFSYSTATFSKQSVEIEVPGSGLLNRIVRKLINNHHNIYEERFAFLYPRHTLRFVLKAEKESPTV